MQCADRRFVLRGELDEYTVRHLIEVVAPIAAQPGDLLLDMAEVSFIGSAGLGALVALSKALGSSKLVLINPHRSVSMVLELTGVVGTTNIRVQSRSDPS